MLARLLTTYPDVTEDILIRLIELHQENTVSRLKYLQLVRLDHEGLSTKKKKVLPDAATKEKWLPMALQRPETVRQGQEKPCLERHLLINQNG